MNEKLVKLPGPDHPISIKRNPSRVIVSVAGRVIADTRNALTLREAAYPEVPPRVEYSLTPWGQALCPALDAILKWADRRQNM